MPIPEGLIDQDFRFNPVTRVFNPETVTNEIKTCTQLQGLNVYGFFLNEIPLKESPSSVTVVRQIDSTAFSEVNIAPVGTQFYVDYHYPDKSNRGIIVLPASEDGKNFIVSYKALGSAMHKNNINALMQQNLAPINTQITNINTQITNINNTLSAWAPKINGLADDVLHYTQVNLSTIINSTVNVQNKKIIIIEVVGSFNTDFWTTPIGNDPDGKIRVPLNINVVGGNTSTINKIIIRFINVSITSYFASLRFHLRVYKSSVLLPFQTYDLHYKEDGLFAFNNTGTIDNIYYRYHSYCSDYTECAYKAFQSGVNGNLTTEMRF